MHWNKSIRAPEALCFNWFPLDWFHTLDLGLPAARWKDFISVLLRTGSDRGGRNSDLDNRPEVKISQRERERQSGEKILPIFLKGSVSSAW